MTMLIFASLLGQISYVQMSPGDVAVVINSVPMTSGWSDPAFIGTADKDVKVRQFFYGRVVRKASYRGNYYYELESDKGTVTIHGGLLKKFDVALARKIYQDCLEVDKENRPHIKKSKRLYAKKLQQMYKEMAKKYSTSEQSIKDVIAIGRTHGW